MDNKKRIEELKEIILNQNFEILSKLDDIESIKEIARDECYFFEEIEDKNCKITVYNDLVCININNKNKVFVIYDLYGLKYLKDLNLIIGYGHETIHVYSIDKNIYREFYTR